MIKAPSISPKKPLAPIPQSYANALRKASASQISFGYETESIEKDPWAIRTTGPQRKIPTQDSSLIFFCLASFKEIFLSRERLLLPFGLSLIVIIRSMLTSECAQKGPNHLLIPLCRLLRKQVFLFHLTSSVIVIQYSKASSKSLETKPLILSNRNR